MAPLSTDKMGDDVGSAIRRAMLRKTLLPRTVASMELLLETCPQRPEG